MAPEQVRGEPAGPHTDVFALGTVLYEMVTGERAFDAPAAVSVLHRILAEEPPRPVQLAPGCPPALEQLILDCLEKEIGRRPATAAQVAERLRELAAAPSPAASPVSSAAGRVAPGPPSGLEQEIRFCTTPDGVRIAYASVGEGTPVIKAANWLNHLQQDWQSPVWSHLVGGLAREHELVRYDARGNGLSDWTIDDLSFAACLRDLETVVDESGLERFALLGISQGCAVAVAYAVAHPERVTRLALHGGFARGAFVRGSKEGAERRRALLTLTRHDWGTASPAFRQLWTSLYLPDGTPEEQEAWNALQRATSPENAAAILESTGHFDIAHLLPQVTVPTLVSHCRGELAIPFSEGETLAQLIPGARFLPLECRNHLVMEHDAAWPIYFSELRRFLAEDAE
ncbi:MAG: alpha/beta fold hydrolase, partial [Thermoanaerobaculia bacterium]|nr:alpha/beta fold hydrolase [Thermoanaerobaculia bacterium]